MFSDIEQKYKKGLSEKRFWEFYLKWATPAVVIAVILAVLLGFNSFLVSALVAFLLAFFAVRFFIRDMQMVIPGKMPKSLHEKLAAYTQADDEVRMKNLVHDLRAHHLQTKDDIRITLEYFEKQRPVTTRTSLLEWVLSVAITLASIVALAYDDTDSAVNNLKLIGIIWPTVKIVLVIMVPILVIGVISKKVFFSRAKIDSILVEDLAYIYVNFDLFEDRLKKEPRQ